ncbi:MAG: hypothetical protein CL823_01295 [Crocinitomicaceae bacterium]|nr:hypothetical protein [Crocinitomicaceae bacterium]|tara:strand:+ start:744 stop:1166 length:423 start_codon:yes stop_codon:yes gene_type:complete
MQQLFKIAGYVLASIFKFVLTPSAMIYYDEGVLKTIIVTSIGAAVGVQIFFHLGRTIFSWWDARGKKKKKTITPLKRRIVGLKNKTGLVGILLISGLISVPISAVIVAKYYGDNKWSSWLLCVAFLVWSIVLTLGSWMFL